MSKQTAIIYWVSAAALADLIYIPFPVSHTTYPTTMVDGEGGPLALLAWGDDYVRYEEDDVADDDDIWPLPDQWSGDRYPSSWSDAVMSTSTWASWDGTDVDGYSPADRTSWQEQGRYEQPSLLSYLSSHDNAEVYSYWAPLVNLDRQTLAEQQKPSYYDTYWRNPDPQNSGWPGYPAPTRTTPRSGYTQGFDDGYVQAFDDLSLSYQTRYANIYADVYREQQQQGRYPGEDWESNGLIPESDLSMGSTDESGGRDTPTWASQS